ncbi:MAG: C40 family peptidase [Treponema sp.]|jgi:probable lipoprotein NlpC|nr:C40 family peptidase [Treponema sp.]
MKGPSLLLCLMFFSLPLCLSGADVPVAEAAAAGEVRARVLRAAGQYLGTPYRYGGADRQGLDCSGLVYLSFREAGVQVPRNTTTLYIRAEPLAGSRILPGDLVFFNTLGEKSGKAPGKAPGRAPVSHVGIYTGDGKFIHAASEGPKTGVIYSALNEDYWQRNYVGAGRFLPPGPLDFPEENLVANPPESPQQSPPDKSPPGPPVADAGKLGTWDGTPSSPAGRTPAGNQPGQWFLGFALAPSWGGIREGTPPLRGGAMSARLAYNPGLFKQPLTFGLELRPEWDADLGVFRLPLTLSLGVEDIIRVFAGPALTLGDPVLGTSAGDRRYTGGAAWLGAVGITLTPVAFPVARGTLSVYGEFAWQSYAAAPGQGENWVADMSAGLRISTGLCYTWPVGK